jgi:hypothetical protein
MTGNPLPSDLWEAFEYYTGGLFTPRRSDPAWCALNGRLLDNNYTGHEFLHFIVHHYASEPNYSRVQRRNLLVSPKTWDAFEEFKETRLRRVGILLESQFKEAALNSSIGVPWERILLEDIFELNPVVRLELALRVQPTGFDISPVLDKYGRYAWELLNGSPEYQLFSPAIMQELEAKTDVYRAISQL